MWVFSYSKGGVILFMKTTIKELIFPSEFKTKLKMKVSTKNLDIEFLPGHVISFNNTNLSVNEPYRIIVKNKYNTLLALLYDNFDKIYLPYQNIIISLTKFVNIINDMNKLA